MKLKFALASAALALVAGSAANAQISISLDNPVLNVGALPQTFTGTVDIQGTSEAVGSSLVGSLPGFTFTNDFQTYLDNFINMNGTFPGAADDYTGAIFTVTGAPAPDPNTPFLVTFSVDDANGPGGTVSVSAVPEPGTVALLVGGLVGGGLVAVRRRRK